MRKALSAGLLLLALLVVPAARGGTSAAAPSHVTAASHDGGLAFHIMIPAAASDGTDAAPPTTPSPGPDSAPPPAPPTPGGDPVVALSTGSAYQGGAVHVAVANATSGTMQALGRSYPLSPDGAGGLEGFIGIEAEDPAGDATVTIGVLDVNGVGQTFDRTLTVLATQWTVDYITIPQGPPSPPPEPGGPEPPPPPPDDTLLLPELYEGQTPRRWLDGWQVPIAQPNLGGCAFDGEDPPVCVSGYFGEQRSINGGPVGGHHTGTDLAAPHSTPITSVNDGTVVLAGRYLNRGNLVVIDHGGGVFSSYGHMSAIEVELGQAVAKGQLLGLVGSTGFSTGPHLHWEMAVGGIRVDGLRWLDGTQGF